MTAILQMPFFYSCFFYYVRIFLSIILILFMLKQVGNKVNVCVQNKFERFICHTLEFFGHFLTKTLEW